MSMRPLPLPIRSAALRWKASLRFQIVSLGSPALWIISSLGVGGVSWLQISACTWLRVESCSQTDLKYVFSPPGCSDGQLRPVVIMLSPSLYGIASLPLLPFLRLTLRIMPGQPAGAG
ncbi:hypothetical protein D3C80_1485970 [compost metagenome]